MLDISQTSQPQPLQTRNECQAHPGFGFDTICFDHACRWKGNQIICSYCGQQEPHASHIDQQHPIYRNSPGFRSINFTKDWHKLPQLKQERENIAQKFQNVKALFVDFIDEMADSSLNKLQCLSELLTKNAVLKVCHKIRQNHRKHQDCCVEVINNLQLRQGGNILCKEEAYKLIQHKFRDEFQSISSKIEYFKNSLTELLGSFNKTISHRVNYDVETSPDSVNKELRQNLDSGLRKTKRFQLKGLCTEQSNPLMLSFNKHDSKNDQGEQQSKQQSLIDELSALVQQPQTSQHQNLAKDIKIVSNKTPIGIDVEKKGIITVWDANPSALSHLKHCKNLKNLIIQDSSLGNTKQFRNLIQTLPQLEGIHINCKSSIDSNILKDLKVPYLNLFPTFRFIQNTDRSKYFPKIKQTVINNLSSNYLKNIYACSKHKRKNNCISSYNLPNIQNKIKQVNFINRQEGTNWRVHPKLIKSRLELTKNLLILVFSNVSLYQDLSLSFVYKNNIQLHTIVFDECKAHYRRLIYQLQSLQPQQLKHFQISGGKFEQRIELTAQSAKAIFSHLSLETLILTNIIFEQNTKENSKFSVFRSINKLSHLKHLNLYDSWPIQAKILQLLHKNCRKQLKYLNIGCSQINNKQRFYKSSLFPKLQSLCLDYTEINQAELAIFMKNSVSLKYLSIQNLNGERIESEQTDQRDNNKCYGLITPQFFMGLLSKSLKYVNIYNCFAFSKYSWEGFDELECVRVNEGLLTQNTIRILIAKGVKLNFIKKDQQYCPKTNNDEKPCTLLNEQQKAVGKSRSRYNYYQKQTEVHTSQLLVSRKKTGNDGLRRSLNQGQRIQKVIDTKKIAPQIKCK